jgi:Ca-activated chloride channel family protein
MWQTAEWAALRAGSASVDSPGALLAAAIGLLALAGIAIWRGAHRVRVPASGGRQRGFAADPAWLLSVALRAGAIGLVALTLTGPVALIPENLAGGTGIDLIIALDASGSMNALDGQIEGRRVTRLELAKHVVANFIRERDGDRIGLVVFGQRAFTQSPLTVDHRLVLESLARVEVGVAGDATAIGEAIGLATQRLDIDLGGLDAASPRPQRILLLLTDGRHNSGKLAPETASQIAAIHGVRIHSVGIGTGGVVPFARRSPGEPLRFEEVDLDRETLQAVARNTGGRFFHARRPQDLIAVAEEIDRLEGHALPDERKLNRASLAPYSLGAALMLLLMEALSAHGVLRRLP